MCKTDNAITSKNCFSMLAIQCGLYCDNEASPQGTFEGINLRLPMFGVLDICGIKRPEEVIDTTPKESLSMEWTTDYNDQKVLSLMVDTYGLLRLLPRSKTENAETYEHCLLDCMIPNAATVFLHSLLDNPGSSVTKGDLQRAKGFSLLGTYDYRETPITPTMRKSMFWFPVSQICAALQIEFYPEIHRPTFGAPLICPDLRGLALDQSMGPVWLTDSVGVRRLILMSRNQVAEDFERYFLTKLLPYCALRRLAAKRFARRKRVRR